MSQLKIIQNNTANPLNAEPFISLKSNTSFKENISIVDLFAGIGGFHYGVQAAAQAHGLGLNTLLVSEIDESCQNTYTKNHNVEVRGDINKIDLEDYNNIADILTAGFPCQPFSNSGKKLGLSDPRGQFYYKIEQFIKHFKAKSFILENVPGIRTNGGGKYLSELSMSPQVIGKTMHFMEENLKNLKDYVVKWIEIDSSDLGSPQVRRRVYFIGLHRDFVRDFHITPSKSNPNSFMSVVENVHIPELELSIKQEQNLRSFMTNPPSYKNGMRRVGKAYLCSGGNVGQGYHAYGLVPTLTKIWARFLPIYFPKENEAIPSVYQKEFLPDTTYGNGYIRRISVREAFRLQGFPDSFIPNDRDSSAYAQAGNAVNAVVVQHLANELLNHINK